MLVAVFNGGGDEDVDSCRPLRLTMTGRICDSTQQLSARTVGITATEQ